MPTGRQNLLEGGLSSAHDVIFFGGVPPPCQPLSAFNGRVTMDLNHATTDVNKFDEFIIAQNFVWWCVNALGILLVLLNLFLPENFEWNF